MSNKLKRKRRKRFSIYIGILKNHDNEYIEIHASNMAKANVTMEYNYPNRVNFVYKASRHSASNLKLIETIRFEDIKDFKLPSFTGDLT